MAKGSSKPASSVEKVITCATGYAVFRYWLRFSRFLVRSSAVVVAQERCSMQTEHGLLESLFPVLGSRHLFRVGAVFFCD